MAHATDFDCVAALEVVDVPSGLCALDALVKQAEVSVVFAGDIDPGRYLIVFGGDLGSCEAALHCGIEVAGRDVVATLLLPQAHPRLRMALHGDLADLDPELGMALGIVQCHTPTTTLASLDRALKSAETVVVRLRFASELAGQGHWVVAGEQHDIEAALQAAQADAPAGVVVRTRLIARPAPETYAAAAQRSAGDRSLRPLDP